MAEKHSPGKVDSQNLRSECTTSPRTYLPTITTTTTTTTLQQLLSDVA